MSRNVIMFGTGASSYKEYDELSKIVEMCLYNEIYCFDTAPSYKTELPLAKTLNSCMKNRKLSREQLYIQTKIDPDQMQDNDGRVLETINRTLDKMNISYIDSLLVHWPLPEYFLRTWEDLQALKAEGLVRKIGICNVRIWNLQQYLEIGIIPDIIQIERNPLRTCYDEIAFCKEHNIQVQAYSPLCKMDARLRDNDILNKIAKTHGKDVGQIILRWHIDTGVVPIFTTKNMNRIELYSQLNDFQLSEEEIIEINALNCNYKLYLESWMCPGI